MSRKCNGSGGPGTHVIHTWKGIHSHPYIIHLCLHDLCWTWVTWEVPGISRVGYTVHSRGGSHEWFWDQGATNHCADRHFSLLSKKIKSWKKPQYAKSWRSHQKPAPRRENPLLEGTGLLGCVFSLFVRMKMSWRAPVDTAVSSAFIVVAACFRIAFIANEWCPRRLSRGFGSQYR